MDTDGKEKSFSYWLLHINTQMLANQQRLTVISSVRIQDAG